jgi:hypothetical protein
MLWIKLVNLDFIAQSSSLTISGPFANMLIPSMKPSGRFRHQRWVGTGLGRSHSTLPFSTLPLTIHFAPLSLMKFQIYTSLDESLKNQQSGPMGTSSAGEIDELKRMFIETNPILLGTTIFVSALHSLFEFLAFKNGKKPIFLSGDCSSNMDTNTVCYLQIFRFGARSRTALVFRFALCLSTSSSRSSSSCILWTITRRHPG